MSETADSGDQLAVSAPVPPIEATDVAVPSGIGPVDERTGGLQQGGSYLIVGTPGPAKMVAALQFLHAGIARGEPVLLLTNADDEGVTYDPEKKRWSDNAEFNRVTRVYTNLLPSAGALVKTTNEAAM